MTFSFGSGKVCSHSMYVTYFRYDKDIWIVAVDYDVYLDIIVLLPLTAILQLINFTAS